ncbi:peptide chain release factor 2 [Sporobacter termitidis DSM 10068]|uniref:Peptide chain release factor 2 n=1 Tax=Sporobacter termitidis DSM 10068 TaxID=1123282 RepID=A0A1M5Z6J0_9FIRM|nr:peptide chain release factor 2 [Sporobacter termitidis]SHI19811.1 peptide chain release factor 2 [Sporobacter termitidis DSM 10068]
MIEFDDYKVKVNALKPALTALGGALKLDDAESELERLEHESAEDGFWNDLDNSQKVLQKIKLLKNKISGYKKLNSRWDDLMALCQMGIEEQDESLLPELEAEFEAFERDLEAARLSTLLSGEYDGCTAIMSFHAGAGGTEAQDWTEMLYRMYTRWAERHGMKYKILDYLDGEEAGIKSASIEIEGENAYGYLKSEGGIHRLVRISPFDASGRRHTSFAAVEVAPLISDDVEVEIRPEDLRVDTYRSSGAGGQHVNKTESAIRITHIPTGIVVACQMERSQHQNREVAMRMLRSKLVEIKEREHLDKISDIKGEQMKIEWGSQIRSYVFMPYTLAKDHRTNFENGNIGAVMDGDIDGFINAYLSMQAGKTE